MCGRFAQFSSVETLQKTFDIGTVACDVESNYNIAPTNEILVVGRQANENRLKRFHWGLVPFWARDLSGASRNINARAETIAKKPTFRTAFKRRRCLIPADGFYEWKTIKGKKGKKGKQPYFCMLPAGEPLAFAGLWEAWKNPKRNGASTNTAIYYSCTIITIDSSESVSEIHNRMPVILLPEAYNIWLDPNIQDTKQLETILLHHHVREIRTYPVATRVNSIKNNDSACIEPIADY